MISRVTPNKAIVLAVAGFIAYWIAAMFVSPMILRDVFNSLAFGTAFIIAVTWLPAAYRAVRENADSGEWQLILAIFLVWFVVVLQRSYAIAFNYYDRPEAWSNSAVSGFWPYSYTIAGLLFLSAPGVKDGDIGGRAVWAIIAAVAIGSFVAGALFMASISTA